MPESFYADEIDPNLEFCTLSHEELSSSKIAKDVDVWILALPNGHSEKYVEELSTFQNDPILIDVSADHRFQDDWVYGLPELQGARENLWKARRISNPGCYATAMQLGIQPLLHFGKVSDRRENGSALWNDAIAPHAFGISGYSGAGTNPSPNNDLGVLEDNLIAYTPVQHIHEREATRHLGTPVGFMPHVAQYFRGIHMTISAYLEPGQSGADPSEELWNWYSSFYEGENLVRVCSRPGDIPQVKDNVYKHHVVLGGFNYDPTTGRCVVVSTIDNLLKGAASQAIQNLNIASGMDEFDGLVHAASKGTDARHDSA